MIQNNKILERYFSKDWFYLAIILLFCIMAVLPMFLLGIPDGNKDFPQHLQFASTYYHAILNGDFLPLWAASDNLGFGSVGIRFYPPLCSFSLALMKILSGNWYDSIWLTFLFWMFVSCIGIYLWAKEWLSSKAATIAAVLYIFLPYHLMQIYQMWLFAEFVACATLPFCFLFATRLCHHKSITNILLFAVSYSLLLLSHIPSIIMGSLSLAVYILFLINWSKWRETFFGFFASFILSLSATGFYLIKIITEINWVKVSNPEYSTGFYDPQQHLFPIFIRAGSKYIERVSWHFDASIFLTILIFIPSIIYLGIKIRNNKFKNTKIFFALSATGLFSFFMMSLPSSLVWRYLPILQKIQFPWRWLSILSMICVILFAFAISQLTLESRNVKRLLTYLILPVLLSVLLFDVTQNIIQSAPLPRNVFNEKLPDLLSQTGCDCWWTNWAKSEAFDRDEKIIADSREVKLNIWSGETREFTIEKGQASDIRVATFYYPYWKAEVNKKDVQVKMDNDGSILIPVGSEKSEVKLYFQEPVLLKILLLLSSVTWLLLLGGLFWAKRNEKHSKFLD